MNDTALTVRQPHAMSQFGEMSVAAIVDRKKKIVEVMQAVMKEGEHYGRIPGCGDKPSLFKAGAEVLATTFGLAPTFDVLEVNLPGGHRECRITCSLTHIATGAIVGAGVGSCSTLESKYRWRKGERLCPKCGKPAIIKGQAQYGGGWLCWVKKNGCGTKWPDGAKEIEDQQIDRVENPDIADVYNTVLKMAKKRAQVDATLTAVGASDILTQDLEDLTVMADSVPRAREPEPRVEREPNEEPADPMLGQALAAIDMASTTSELESLLPDLAKLSTTSKSEARKHYGFKKKQLSTTKETP